MAYDPADLVTADDTSPEHAEACSALLERVVAAGYVVGYFEPVGGRQQTLPVRIRDQQLARGRITVKADP